MTLGDFFTETFYSLIHPFSLCRHLKLNLPYFSGVSLAKMDTSSRQKLTSLAIFAIFIVTVQGDFSDLTGHDLTIIKQMENFENNLNGGK
jgi:hypothetical protein